jgi:uncharacterized protein (TIGR03663 family)
MAKPSSPPRRKPRFRERNALLPRPTTPRKPPAPAAVAAPPPPPRSTIRAALPRITVEQGLFAAVVLAGLILRLWDVGSRAMHGDEAVHAWFAWNLYTGKGLQYDPVYHGPLQFSLTAGFYFLFGVSEVTGRLLSVLCGAALVGTPYFLRQYMGRAGALVASVIIALSPAFVFVSRLERDDSILALGTLVLAVGLLGFLRTRKPRFLYLMGGAAALSLSAFEATYITLFIFGTFLIIVIGSELLTRSRFGPSMRELWQRTGQAQLPHYLVLPIVLAVLLAAFLLTVTTGLYPPVPFLLALLVTALVHRQTVLEAPESGDLAATGAVRSISGVVWLNTATIVVAILFLVYSTFGTNLNGIWDSAHTFFNNGNQCSYNSFPLNACRRDILGGLFYWLSQHSFARGGQPWFYYTMLFGLYEQLIVVFGIGGIIWTIRRPTLFRSFLTYWAVWSFGIYSWAGEKFPWLVIHPLLPFTLLSAMFIVELARQAKPVRVVTVAVVAALAVLELHSTYELNFVHGADVQDPMVYTTSTPDTPLVAQEILNISNKATNGNDLHLTIDSLDTWPFAWYLRDLPNAAYPGSSQVTQSAYISNPVQIIDEADQSLVASKLSGKYTFHEYGLRWALYPETYKDLTWSSFFHEAVDPGYWSVVTRWLLDRRPMAATQTDHFYLYVKKGYVSPY